MINFIGWCITILNTPAATTIATASLTVVTFQTVEDVKKHVVVKVVRVIAAVRFCRVGRRVRMAVLANPFKEARERMERHEVERLHKIVHDEVSDLVPALTEAFRRAHETLPNKD